MSELNQSPQKYPLKSFEQAIPGNPESHEEIIQFTDGATGLLHRVEGQKPFAKNHKHINPNGLTSCTVLTTTDGTRIATGTGVIAVLPKINRRTGELQEVTNRPGIEVSVFAPEGLDDVTIGEEWRPVAEHGRVESALTMYKIYTPDHEGWPQVDMPSYLEEGMKYLMSVAGELFDDDPRPMPLPPPVG